MNIIWILQINVLHLLNNLKTKTMDIIVIILASIGISMSLSAIYLMKRNENVYKFLVNIKDICYKHDLNNIEKDGYCHHILSSIMDRLCPTAKEYAKMIFSFKKLKYENYLTKEEIETLKL